MSSSKRVTGARRLRRARGGVGVLAHWLGGLAVMSAGCVNLTPPWEQVNGADAGTGGIAGRDAAADGPLASGGSGGRTGAVDGAPALLDTAGAGGTGGTLDGEVVVPDVPLATGGTAGAVDGPPSGTGGAAADIGPDVPMGGNGGAALDASSDLAAGGRGGSGGSTTGKGGAGGTSTGKGGSGGTTSSGGTRTGGSSGTGGTKTGGTSGTGGSGGSTLPDAAGICTGQTPIDAGTGITQGLVAYYPCEQATGTTLPDQSGNGQNGTLVTGTGGTAGYSFGTGKVGNALDFAVKNKGYATLPAGLLANACEATVATWVYLNNNANWQRIFDFGKDQNVYMFLTTTNSVSSKLRFAITIGGNGSAAEQIIEGQAALPTGAWHHVAVVLGAGGGILYLDGAQVGTNPSVTLRPADLGNPPNYYIGKSQFSQDPTLDGDIDELRIYNRALSPTEILSLFSGS